MMITRKGIAPIAAIGVVVGLSSCAVNSQPAAAPQQTTTTQTAAAAALHHSEFASVDSARQAVDRVIGCDEKPKTDPIINPDLAGFTAEYVVCANRVQVVWFKTEEAKNAEHQLHSDSAQPLTIVEGGNWMVVDMSEALNEPPSGKDLRALAQEYGGNFRYVSGVGPS